MWFFRCSIINNYWMRFFVVSRIIMVKVRVISRSRRPRPWLFWISQKTESNNCFIIHWTKKEMSRQQTFTCNPGSCFASSPTASHTKRANLTWSPMTLTWLLYNLQAWRHKRWVPKLTVRFRPIRKEIASSMYNNHYYCYYYPLFVTVNVSTEALIINHSLHQVNDLRQREPFAGC